MFWTILLNLAWLSLAWAAPSVGNPAPDLVVPELDGKTFDLASLRGKVVVVDFWATWCPSCRDEMNALDAVYRKNHSRGLELIALSTDRSRERKHVTEAMKELSYPAGMLSDAKTNRFGPPESLPELYVIDRKGIVRAKPAAKDLAAAIEPLLTEPAAPAR
jgi:cytochrome c biogenesis protein CcmG/thiol:disulfide interchange protein DsbE